MVLTDELDVLQALLSCAEDNRERTDVFLKEKDPIAKLKKLHLSELDNNMLVLAIDEHRKIKNRQGKVLKVCMSPLFSEQDYGHNKACDAVILRKAENGLEICYIDLKSDDPRGFEKQFKSTQCFMHYLFDLSKSLCNVEIQIIKERFVIFHTDSNDAVGMKPKPKMRLSFQSGITPDSPKKRAVRNGDTVRCTEIF